MDKPALVGAGVEYNYRIILVRDVVAEVDRITHETDLKGMSRIFAEVMATGKAIDALPQTRLLGEEDAPDRCRIREVLPRRGSQ